MVNCQKLHLWTRNLQSLFTTKGIVVSITIVSALCTDPLIPPNFIAWQRPRRELASVLTFFVKAPKEYVFHDFFQEKK